MNFTALLPTFLITLREGVEAALVVGIVMAYLNKAGKSQLNRWVYLGIGLGILASGAIGVVFNGTLWALSQSNQVYAPIAKQFLEAGLGLVAIGLLSWMLVWMTQQAKSLKKGIEGDLSSALQTADGAGLGIFGIIFLAVLREGFETVVFIAAQFQQGWLPVGGAVLGLLGATLIGILLFKWGIQINLKQFFQVMGVFLLLIVGGLVIGALAHLDRGMGLLNALLPDPNNLCLTPDPSQLGSCLLGPQVWNGQQVLPDRQFPGIVLKTLLGYRDRLYLGEMVAYLVFWSTVGSYYLRTISETNASRSSTSESSQP
ncbi:FTR1 family protein [Alkalinema sp. FACHB-956]|uniref:FTR1 family iron permease n=1 Tax=Alkalinema sp. FACHB-956 TaxID=2692768 RepID=UPI00168813CA|nr:FTR1 family protein [Alkalinema sp. FACHB-956]MBD2326115.1 FTR1 family iron permease [Alkalinema sp. FACHB-956]